MRATRRAWVTAALVAALLPWSASSRAEPAPDDLASLSAQLQQATAKAQEMADRLSAAAAQDMGLKVAWDRMEQAHAQAQAVLDSRARQVYMVSSGTVSGPLTTWTSRLASPELQFLAQRGATAALQVDQDLVDLVADRAAQLKALQRQAEARRRLLLPQLQAVLAQQERARELLARAQALAAAQQAVEAAAQLERQRAQLDDISLETTLALTPGQAARARRAIAREEPVVQLLERSGSMYPAGYAPTGQVIVGDASWYGPGFVGNPTASGAPYDPERLTCAHKALPLGTVIRVSRQGLAVSCLVNDRGPYVGARVLDMSRAGARALGYSGVARVTIEVLAPV